jgi:hypothetical protein
MGMEFQITADHLGQSRYLSSILVNQLLNALPQFAIQSARRIPTCCYRKFIKMSEVMGTQRRIEWVIFDPLAASGR